MKHCYVQHVNKAHTHSLQRLTSGLCACACTTDNGYCVPQRGRACLRKWCTRDRTQKHTHTHNYTARPPHMNTHTLNNPSNTTNTKWKHHTLTLASVSTIACFIFCFLQPSPSYAMDHTAMTIFRQCPTQLNHFHPPDYHCIQTKTFRE